MANLGAGLSVAFVLAGVFVFGLTGGTAFLFGSVFATGVVLGVVEGVVFGVVDFGVDVVGSASTGASAAAIASRLSFTALCTQYNESILSLALV